MTDPLLKKLQHRDGTRVLVLWPPSELETVLERWVAEGVTVHRRIRGGSSFVLAFVRSCKEIHERAERVTSVLGGDYPILWLAYPKKGSKRYASDGAGRLLAGDRGPRLRAGPPGCRRRGLVGAAVPAGRAGRDTDEVPCPFGGRTEAAGGASGPRRPRRRGLARRPAGAAPDHAATIHLVVRQAAPELAPSLAGRSIGYGPFTTSTSRAVRVTPSGSSSGTTPAM